MISVRLFWEGQLESAMRGSLGLVASSLSIIPKVVLAHFSSHFSVASVRKTSRSLAISKKGVPENGLADSECVACDGRGTNTHVSALGRASRIQRPDSDGWSH